MVSVLRVSTLTLPADFLSTTCTYFVNWSTCTNFAAICNQVWIKSELTSIVNKSRVSIAPANIFEMQYHPSLSSGQYCK